MVVSHSENIPFRNTALAKSSGFTLIEILIVIGILVTLAAIAYPFYTGYIDKAKVTLGISTLETVRKTIEDYNVENGNYPPDIDPLTGRDSLGHIVLPAALLDEFKTNLFSMVSYVATINTYTLTATAINSKHTLLVLTPGQVIKQGP
jgi:prepilin-type N-terminal cleavage/methylation domain-containing protein